MMDNEKIVAPEGMYEYFKELSQDEEGRLFVIGDLKKGSRVSKSMANLYQIDNPEIHKVLGDFSRLDIPYGPVNRKLKSDSFIIKQLFEKEAQSNNGSRVLPFSRVVDSGVGECLEKAVLFQLAVQNKFPCFLINGAHYLDNDFCDYHAFNILFNQGKVYLTDVENPLAKGQDGKVFPYIVPINSIARGVIKVPEEYRHKRNYEIFS